MRGRVGGKVKKENNMKTDFFDVSDVNAVRFECSICHVTTTIPVEGITRERISEAVVQHCHIERGSNPAGVGEDIDAILKFFAEHLKAIAAIMNRRNLRLQLEIKRAEGD
jgi:hypothetical protein